MGQTGKIIVITGGCSGIGRQLAEDCLSAGATVVLVSDREDRLSATLSAFRSRFAHADGHVADVGDAHAVTKLCNHVLQTHGPPDILVNNAGFATYRTIEESPLEELERLVNVNFLGAVRCTKGFLPEMIKRGAGSIVNIASVAGRIPITPNGTYGAAKHALVAWSTALRWELSRFNIHVNLICPGRVETAFFDHETFVSRLPRPETRFTVPVQTVSRETIRAIERNRAMTYIPWILGPAIWAMQILQPVTDVLYGKLMRDRIESVYRGADEG